MKKGGGEGKRNQRKNGLSYLTFANFINQENSCWGKKRAEVDWPSLPAGITIQIFWWKKP